MLVTSSGMTRSVTSLPFRYSLLAINRGFASSSAKAILHHALKLSIYTLERELHSENA